MIKRNEGYELFSLGESGLEANNKVMKNIRVNISRKQNEEANMVDMINRMWLISDPGISTERMKGRPYCKLCMMHGHSKRYCPKLFENSLALTEEHKMIDELYKAAE